MRAKINTSGTHVQNGVLKVRVDLYPDPADKTYARHYADHYDREPTEAELADPAKLALVPTHREINPCLCHFIAVDEDITVQQLEARVRAVFDAGTLAALDDALDRLADDTRPADEQALARDTVGQTMRAGKSAGIPAIRGRVADVVIAANERLGGLEVAL
jgi:hypothetical protein